MKIVILHPHHWKQSLGGAELQISYLVKYLVKLGHQVYYIYEDTGTPIQNDENIQLYPLKRIKNWFGKRFSLYVFNIKNILKIIKPDVIYTRTFLSWSGIASSYANKEGVKHIWAIANDKELERPLKLKYVLQPFNYIEIYITKKAFKRATHIITQNSYQQSTIEKIFNRKSIRINQIGQGINGERIVKSDKITIVWIAHLRTLKHPEYFIQLVKKLQSHTSLEFLMMGKMDCNYGELIQRAEREFKNFQYLGEIPNNKVNEILCKSHILISTSDFEGFSNTFIQAWMRKVVVISMNSNPDEILTKYEIGFQCKSLDGIKDIIQNLIKNKNQLNGMGEKAYNYAMKNHSLEKLMPFVVNLMD